MKRVIFFLLLSIFLATPAFAQRERVKQLFNEGWFFHKGEVSGGEKPSFDHSGWRPTALPHDWSVEGPFSEQWASGTGYLPAGIGWYRKSFDVPEALQDKPIFLYFDGVYKNSEVWINGPIRQSLWSEKPVAFIGALEIPKEGERRGRHAAPHWNWKGGEKLRLSAYTNSPEAELFLNGKSLGRRLHQGKLLAYVQSQQKPGKVKVTFTSKGLKPKVEDLRVN